MFEKVLAIAAVGGLVLAACGDDDDGGGSDLSDDQQAAADAAVEAGEEGGMAFDRECIEDLAGQLSDEDAQAIAEADGGDAELSPEGEELSLQLLNCADSDALVDTFIAGMQESGQEFDEDCVRSELENFDMGEIAQSGAEGEPPPELVEALVGCFSLGG